MAFGVVDADRPEAIYGYFLDDELIDSGAIVLAGRDVEVKGVFLGIAAEGMAVPIRCRTGSTSSLGPNMHLESGRVVPSARSASRTFFWLSLWLARFERSRA
jgi:hypothetical protein